MSGNEQRKIDSKRPGLEAFVYCWTDHKADMLYIGWHLGHPDDGYICSSKYMLKEYNNRPQDFTRQIIATGQREDMFRLEQTIIRTESAHLSDRYYNRSLGGLANISSKSRKLIGKANKKLWNDLEFRKKMMAAQKQGWTQEAKGKASASAKERWLDNIQIEEYSNKTKELWADSEYRSKQSLSRSSKEFKEKQANKTKELWADPKYRKRKSESIKLSRDDTFKEKARNRFLNLPDETCPHCNKSGKGIAMFRWHFDNCKERK